ncbi:hypothetical protein [Chelativorans intermedius]|uniref:Uncharacterized protein n=1 Tax=Chelativorans intermedius TaxID=515947 RepID=A0ABV6D610_9HYPH|nr:hypothetical protein [Chelativorans intermedius]MCT8997467.1 hypothetical protein [Chelativorans intermedius]
MSTKEQAIRLSAIRQRQKWRAGTRLIAEVARALQAFAGLATFDRKFVQAAGHERVREAQVRR